jgi:hypothetical protein
MPGPFSPEPAITLILQSSELGGISFLSKSLKTKDAGEVMFGVGCCKTPNHIYCLAVTAYPDCETFYSIAFTTIFMGLL